MKKEVATQAMMLYQKKFGGRLVDISIMFANVILALVEAEEAAQHSVQSDGAKSPACKCNAYQLENYGCQCGAAETPRR